MSNADFHEIWWIYSPINGREWAGLRIAHFRKSLNGVLIVIIQGEMDQRRVGMRDWEMLQREELWYKVKQIPIPNWIEIAAAAMKLPEDDNEHIVHRPTREAGDSGSD